jgi:hypothetical protein
MRLLKLSLEELRQLQNIANPSLMSCSTVQRALIVLESGVPWSGVTREYQPRPTGADTGAIAEKPPERPRFSS